MRVRHLGLSLFVRSFMSCAAGVPQLSVGSKAVLTATPDYVSFPIECRDAHILTCRPSTGVWRARLPARHPPELDT